MLSVSIVVYRAQAEVFGGRYGKNISIGLFRIFTVTLTIKSLKGPGITAFPSLSIAVLGDHRGFRPRPSPFCCDSGSWRLGSHTAPVGALGCFEGNMRETYRNDTFGCQHFGGLVRSFSS